MTPGNLTGPGPGSTHPPPPIRTGMDTLTERARSLPIIARPDVLVVGGGAAGLAAAIAAAECGASTLLIEHYGFLGGTLTAVTLGTLCGGYLVSGEAHREIVAGLYADLVGRLAARGAALAPRRWLDNVSVPYDPVALRHEADRMAMGAGVELLLHSTVVDAQVQNGRVSAVIIENKGGRGAIVPAVVIDASGDGDLAARAGAAFAVGDHGRTQFASTMLRLGGVQVARFAQVSREERQARLAQAAAEGYALPRTSAGLQLHPQRGVVHANVTRIRGADGSSPDLLDAAALSAAEVEGRRQAYLYEDVLRRYMPGFEQARIIDIGCHLGVRETRLIEGDHRLEAAELRAGAQPPDTIACCAWPMETHGADSGTVWDWLPPDVWYGIPYRCLTVRHFDNLLVAGRNLSASHAAQSSARVAATCMAMGEAAGVAAALSLQAGADIRGFAPALLRQRLLDRGALLAPRSGAATHRALPG